MSRLPSSRRVLTVLVTAAGLCGAAALRGADVTLASAWRSSPITVDGLLTDWNGLERVEQGPTVAARNDATSLYLAVASDDTVIRRQLASGLVVWFDASNGRAQAFGVRLEGLAPRPLPGATPDAATSGELPRNGTQTVLDRFDLLGPEKNQRRLVDQPASYGMAFASGVDGRSVVYELKVPLEKSASTPYAIGAAPGRTVAIGIQTPEAPRLPRTGDGGSDRMAPDPWLVDPYYGGYFNPPPPTFSGDQPKKDQVLKPMKLLWVSVKLAVNVRSRPPAVPRTSYVPRICRKSSGASRGPGPPAVSVVDSIVIRA
jgi:hypothetical protein